jgi:CTP-dependent riboflavin kinase
MQLSNAKTYPINVELVSSSSTFPERIRYQPAMIEITMMISFLEIASPRKRYAKNTTNTGFE